ncbi:MULTISPECIES: hypothetical protein [Bradyrhizobium]|uniref:Uncharacterized protein n=1 Tax=Bradyrhizobium septentrionale TaxID=1404411 RepID=A0A973ZZV0_9BRAD|nr:MULTISPECIES: hypothetical protein [Bradyrhizobium]QIG97682.1 hypothetical protein G6P99_38490 [Bradyrhizobium sp. 6(2017)]UGY20095.1 hypothetical protein HAP48_0023070 [Bradyrhizobium septentrionale]UGY28949.1 hypothetical protein HU675_0020470 [Bradyrhizobium septentrionale]
MTVSREVNEVKSIILRRNLFVIHDAFDGAITQPPLHRRDIGRPLLLRNKKAPIIASRLQDYDVGSRWNGVINALEHTSRGIEGNAGIDDGRVDALRSRQGF